MSVRPPKDVIDLKIRMYSRRYWKCAVNESSPNRRCAMVFVLVNYFEYSKTECAAKLRVSRRQIHYDLQDAANLIRYPRIYRQKTTQVIEEIRRIYNYIL